MTRNRAEVLRPALAILCEHTYRSRPPLLNDTDVLLGAARDGDRRVFDRLTATQVRPLRAHGSRMLSSMDEAEDALQETLLAAWKGLTAFEGRSSLRSWLDTIATHACLRMLSAAHVACSRGTSPPRSLIRASLGRPCSTRLGSNLG